MKAGDRVRVLAGDRQPDDRYTGREGVIVSHNASPSWPLRVQFDDGETTLFHADEVELANPSPRDRRLAATAAVARAEEELRVARENLRAARVAEIAALPVLAQTTNMDEIREILATLGDDCECKGRPAGISLSGYYPRCLKIIAADYSGKHGAAQSEWSLTGPNAVSLDAAVKGALTWLAERDVWVMKEEP